eukprot:Blabericola_migrator_1__3405@NODE_1_length_33786_cov_123_788665_g0_i0_p1_GENE_NODE_1_length_33786_cov_123_788665_g0_i0NODE_1_length_33786_cov_123_788665_g0_i0_p1_ORF_typecomplete_len1048_score146_06SAC3_GANP/PF03399_16/1_3e37CSN8_PSD8_EIF3K/PF10075_9/0_18CSN8_PSD8_EIF3K/PF10075_9/0_12_NODE_1_length_33786_cov_123_788665_g0_i01585418997
MISPAAEPAAPSQNPVAAEVAATAVPPPAAPIGTASNATTPSFQAPLEFFKLAMSMMGGTMGSSGLGLSPLSDPRLTRYAQAIKGFEVARQMQVWLANGHPIAIAKVKAEASVKDTFDQPPFSLWLYIAAGRAMNLDAATGGRNFQASVAQAAVELANPIAALQQSVAVTSDGSTPVVNGLTTFQGLHFNTSNDVDISSAHDASKSAAVWMSAACADSVNNIPPVQAPPPPPCAQQMYQISPVGDPSPMIGHPDRFFSSGDRLTKPYSANLIFNGSNVRPGVGGTRGARSPNAASTLRVDDVAELKQITLPSNLATRILATKWIHNTYTVLIKKIPHQRMDEKEWSTRLCAFIKAVVDGLARYPEEGSAMRWLSLPTPTPDFVMKVSDEPGNYVEEMPGFYGKPASGQGDADASGESTRSASVTPLSNGPSTTIERKTAALWVPPTRSAVSSGSGRQANEADKDSDDDVETKSLSSLSSAASGYHPGGRYGNGSAAKRRRTAGDQPDQNSKRHRSSPSNESSSHVRTVAYDTTSGFIPVSSLLPPAFSLAGKQESSTSLSALSSASSRWKLGTSLSSKQKKGGAVSSATLVKESSEPRELARRHARAMRFSTSPREEPTVASRAAASSSAAHAFSFVISTSSDSTQSTTQSASPSPPSHLLRPMTWQEKLAVVTCTKKVEGLSTELEKSYLRLCGPPDPVLVRSKSALQNSFFFVLRKFFTKVLGRGQTSLQIGSPMGSDSPYHYIDEQLRSIRQDYVVQGIQTPFLYFVYSVNARISQIYEDLGQFNQCQSQMKQLERILPCEPSQNVEFMVYRLLYAALNNLDSDYYKLELALRGNQEVFRHPAVQFAVQIRSLLMHNNFARYFRLTSAHRLDARSAAASDRDNSTVPTSTSAATRQQQEQEVELRVLQDLIEAFAFRWQQLGAIKDLDDPEAYKDEMEIIQQVSDDVWHRHERLLGLPFMCRSLLRVAAPRFRMAFLCILSKAHYTISLEDLASWLHIERIAECKEFLRSQKAVFDNREMLDCRKSYPLFLQSSLLSKKVKAMG